MATLEINADTFEETITDNDVVLVDFGPSGVDRVSGSGRSMKRPPRSTTGLCSRSWIPMRTRN